MSNPAPHPTAPCAEQSPPRRAPNPGETLVGALAGAALLVLGHRRGGRGGLLAEMLGAGIVANALAPVAEHWLVRSGSARRRVAVRCELHVERSVGDVFEFCRNFENFPRVMHAVESVADFEDGRSHWTVRTAAGRRLEWNAMVTKYVPRSVIAWHSVPGSEVDTGGVIRFEPIGPRETRLTIELSYRPCATDLREAVFALLEIAPARVIASELETVPELLREYPVPAVSDADADEQARSARAATDRAIAPGATEPRTPIARAAAAPEPADGERVATSPVTPGPAMPRGTERDRPSRPA